MEKRIISFLLIVFVLCFSTSCNKSDNMENLSDTKNEDNEIDSSQNDSIYVSSGKVIDSYISNSNENTSPAVSSNQSYAVPKNGTWNFDSKLRDALTEYAEEEVTYFLGLSIFPDELSSNVLEIDSNELIAELERLTECGYNVGYSEAWTYQGAGEQIYYKYTAGYFTADELEQFIPNENYGYFFHFVTNGDSSPVSAEQGIITDFAWEEQFAKS